MRALALAVLLAAGVAFGQHTPGGGGGGGGGGGSSPVTGIDGGNGGRITIWNGTSTLTGNPDLEFDNAGFHVNSGLPSELSGLLDIGDFSLHYLEISGSDTIGPTISAVGSGANIPVILVPKGDAGVVVAGSLFVDGGVKLPTDGKLCLDGNACTKWMKYSSSLGTLDIETNGFDVGGNANASIDRDLSVGASDQTYMTLSGGGNTHNDAFWLTANGNAATVGIALLTKNFGKVYLASDGGMNGETMCWGGNSAPCDTNTHYNYSTNQFNMNTGETTFNSQVDTTGPLKAGYALTNPITVAGSNSGNPTITSNGTDTGVSLVPNGVGITTAVGPFNVKPSADTSFGNLDLHATGATDGADGYSMLLTNQATAYSASPVAGTEVILNTHSTGDKGPTGMGGWWVGKENTTDFNTQSYFAIGTHPSGGNLTEAIRWNSLQHTLLGTATDVSSREAIKVLGSDTYNLALLGTGGVGLPKVLFKHDTDTNGESLTVQENLFDLRSAGGGNILMTLTNTSIALPSARISCAMSASTTCTATVASGDVCMCQATSGAASPVSCAVSSTTATCTASVANSATWNVFAW